MKGLNTILGTLPADEKNYKIFHGTEDELDDFVAMKSPWCLIHVIAIKSDGNKEDHILSCFKRNEMGCYYIIESAATNVVMFRFHNLTNMAKTLFIEKQRSNLTNKLSEKGPFSVLSQLN